jgi:hypothetical protein
VAPSNSTSAQLAFLVSTPWAQSGFAPTNQRYNPYENVLAPWNASQLDVAWVLPNGLISGSPVEAGGIVFVGSYDSSLYAINAATGTLGSAQVLKGSFGPLGVVKGQTARLSVQAIAPNPRNGQITWGDVNGNITRTGNARPRCIFRKTKAPRSENSHLDGLKKRGWTPLFRCRDTIRTEDS